MSLTADAEPADSKSDSFKGPTHYEAEYRNTLSNMSGKGAELHSHLCMSLTMAQQK